MHEPLNLITSYHYNLALSGQFMSHPIHPWYCGIIFFTWVEFLVVRIYMKSIKGSRQIFRKFVRTFKLVVSVSNSLVIINK